MVIPGIHCHALVKLGGCSTDAVTRISNWDPVCPGIALHVQLL
jgi:hypothetical protein